MVVPVGVALYVLRDDDDWEPIDDLELAKKALGVLGFPTDRVEQEDVGAFIVDLSTDDLFVIELEEEGWRERTAYEHGRPVFRIEAEWSF